jgi:hypothetical protein
MKTSLLFNLSKYHYNSRVRLKQARQKMRYLINQSNLSLPDRIDLEQQKGSEVQHLQMLLYLILKML